MPAHTLILAVNQTVLVCQIDVTQWGTVISYLYDLSRNVFEFFFKIHINANVLLCLVDQGPWLADYSNQMMTRVQITDSLCLG